ncbi:unnamed protein product [Spirodela intermedia]|uniref:Alcohol dehydrogenase-like N-terminal domain-containing protein n=1 Tax=Spirodela intermedia TaxID=51605 RepID=A0A7I8JK78_SPIIN|nr:unnamed protein product [Spirodela intermedia]CAA6670586.1 unnamed protein product [Spirodela intermedia]
MGSMEERKVIGWAARDASGVLSPYTYTLRETGQEDVLMKVLYCGICHTDIHQLKNHLGASKYPMVPGICGYTVPAGDLVGSGVLVGCCRSCGACTANIEQYCNKKIWSYNDVYTDGKPTQGGFSTAMVPAAALRADEAGAAGGVLGLGGVGHMGVKIAKAMDHHVTVISSSDKSTPRRWSTSVRTPSSLDYIIDTVPVVHPLEPYLSLLKLDGKLILNGVINEPLKKAITGTFIGSMDETQEMLELSRWTTSTRPERLEGNDVRYRFVVDVAGSNLD